MLNYFWNKVCAIIIISLMLIPSLTGMRLGFRIIEGRFVQKTPRSGRNVWSSDRIDETLAALHKQYDIIMARPHDTVPDKVINWLGAAYEDLLRRHEYSGADFYRRLVARWLDNNS